MIAMQLPPRFPIEDGKLLIPLGLQRNYDIDTLKAHHLGSTCLKMKCRGHPVQLAFASTVHKIQEQTCNKIIVHLIHRPFVPQMNFHSVYVALSRT